MHHRLSPVSTIDASDFREEHPRGDQACSGSVMRSTPSTAGEAASEIQSEVICSDEGGHSGQSGWNVGLKATGTCTAVPGEAAGCADASAHPSEQNWRSAEAAANLVSRDAQENSATADAFAVAARATDGTSYREVDLVLYEALGAAQSRRGSAAAVVSETLTAAPRPANASGSTDVVCNACEAEQYCQIGHADQETLAVTSVTAAGARATTGTDEREIDNVLLEAVGAEQSRRSSAAAQETLNFTAVPASGRRELTGAADQRCQLCRANTFAQ